MAKRKVEQTPARKLAALRRVKEPSQAQRREMRMVERQIAMARTARHE